MPDNGNGYVRLREFYELGREVALIKQQMDGMAVTSAENNRQLTDSRDPLTIAAKVQCLDRKVGDAGRVLRGIRWMVGIMFAPGLIYLGYRITVSVADVVREMHAP